MDKEPAIRITKCKPREDTDSFYKCSIDGVVSEKYFNLTVEQFEQWEQEFRRAKAMEPEK